jgi:hypothetical protein
MKSSLSYAIGRRDKFDDLVVMVFAAGIIGAFQSTINETPAVAAIPATTKTNCKKDCFGCDSSRSSGTTAKMKFKKREKMLHNNQPDNKTT